MDHRHLPLALRRERQLARLALQLDGEGAGRVQLGHEQQPGAVAAIDHGAVVGDRGGARDVDRLLQPAVALAEERQAADRAEMVREIGPRRRVVRLDRPVSGSCLAPRAP